jgi:hypothetical protein
MMYLMYDMMDVEWLVKKQISRFIFTWGIRAAALLTDKGNVKMLSYRYIGNS